MPIDFIILIAIVVAILVLAYGDHKRFIDNKLKESSDNTFDKSLEHDNEHITEYVPERANTFSRDRYLEHIVSEKWTTIRKIRLSMDNFKCQQCGIPLTLETAHCHHITYERLGHEKYADVISLCAFCHNEVHEFHGKNAKRYPILKN